MYRQKADAISIQIESEIQCVGSRALSERSIFRVTGPLRQQNEKAYEPSIVAIGPYHRGKKDLIWMEDHKLRYLDILLKRRKESHNVDKYIKAMKVLEQQARKCYAEPINLDSDKFVRMLLLDGCFIIEFCRNFMLEHVRDNEPNFRIVQTGPIRMGVLRDLMLLENQLPFCVLEQLFHMTRDPNNSVEGDINLEGVILCTLCAILPSSEVLETSEISANTIRKVPEYLGYSSKISTDHLLSLVHEKWRFSSCQSVSNVENQGKKWEFINCTTELKEAGIKFNVAEESVHLFDIKFEKGVLKIPRLIVTDETETVFRNLIAYEQCSYSYKKFRHVTNYIIFMDRLINSAKDVEQLRKKRIISNLLGDDEAVSTMINKLGNNVEIDMTDFCYIEVFNKVNKHCGARRNIWLEKLNRNYFHSPWSIISVLAAIVLLVLTLLQTIFSILSYHNKF